MTCKEVVHIVYPEEGKKEAALRARMGEVLRDALYGPHGTHEEKHELKRFAMLADQEAPLRLAWGPSGII